MLEQFGGGFGGSALDRNLATCSSSLATPSSAATC